MSQGSLLSLLRIDSINTWFISLISHRFSSNPPRQLFFKNTSPPHESDPLCFKTAPACDTWPRATWRNQWCLYWRLEPDRSSSHHRTLPVDYSLSNAPWRCQGQFKSSKLRWKGTTVFVYNWFMLTWVWVILREETHETSYYNVRS